MIFFFNEYFLITEMYISKRKGHMFGQYLHLVFWVLKETETIQIFLHLCWKKGKNESETICILKQFVVKESIGFRKHWSSQVMLIIPHPSKSLSIIPKLTRKPN